MALADFSQKTAQAAYIKHNYSRQHNLKVLDIAGVPDYVSNELIEQEGRVYLTSYTVPGRSLSVLEVPYGEMTYRMPNKISYSGTYQITASCASDYLLRNALERWQFSVMSELTGCGGSAFPCDSSTLTIVVLGPNCEIVRGYRLIGIFPSEISEISYDQSSTERVTFTFTLAYQRWEPVDINDVISTGTDANQIDSIFEGFESKIAAGVGSNCANKTNIPRV